MKQASDRLKKVLEVGSTLALFSFLKDWPTEELQALLTDVGEYAEFADAAIDRAWAKTAMKPSLFFSKKNSDYLDRLRDKEKIKVIGVTAEICSVAIYYLEERGVKTPDDPDA